MTKLFLVVALMTAVAVPAFAQSDQQDGCKQYNMGRSAGGGCG